jgi:iron complex outermembrane receptor protein
MAAGLLRSATIATLLVPQVALAQVEPADEARPQLEAKATGAPLVVFSRDQILSSGFASIGDFLQQLPQQGGATNTNVNNGGDGETQISLRSLGAQYTLVLVDGKRWVNGGSGAGTAVDLDSIPTAAVERIEVLLDGASALYGSDAIGGVVNIVTRKRADGVEASAYYGQSRHGDARQVDLNFTSGASTDRGGFLFSAGYFNQSPVLAANRDWAKQPLLYDYSAKSNNVSTSGSGTIPQGRFRVDLNNCGTNQTCNDLRAAFGNTASTAAHQYVYFTRGVSTAANNAFIPGAPLLAACAAGPVPGSRWASCQVDGFRPYISATVQALTNLSVNDLYDYQAVNDLVTPSERISLFANGDYRLADWARAYVQGSFVRRRSSNQLAAEPFITSQFGVWIPADQPFNPFGQTVTDVRRRLVEDSPRGLQFDIDTLRTVIGVDGTLPGEALWEASFVYGRTAGSTTNRGSQNMNEVAGGVATANLFGGPGTLTPAMISALGGYSGIANGWTQLAEASAQLRAAPFSLASDKAASVVAGWDYRAMYGGFSPDPIGLADASYDYNSAATKGSYHVNEGYLSLDLPILSNMSGVDDFEAQAAIRVYDHSNFGAGAVYRLGAIYRPVRDFALRGSFSTNLREPNLSELYQGLSPTAEPATDPCAFILPNSALGQRCALWAPKQGGPSSLGCNDADCGEFVIQSTTGGNPSLQPEEAVVATAGIAFEPQALRGFAAQAGYYNIKVTQQPGFFTSPVIINGCYFGNIDFDCTLIHRDPTTGNISNIFDIERNVGTTQTSGFDFEASYSLPTSYGRFGFSFNSTYLIYYRQTSGSGQLISAAGNYDLGSGNAVGTLTPKFKFNAGVRYQWRGFSTTVDARYIGGFDECPGSDGASDFTGTCSNPSLFDVSGNNIPTGTPGGSTYAPHHVPPYVAFDVFVSYLLKTPVGSTTFAIGVHNLLDASPPPVYDSFLTYADPSYDFVGRFVYGRIQQSF